MTWLAMVVLLMQSDPMLQPVPRANLPWDLGCYGVSLGDLDDDGRLDVVYSPHSKYLLLFRNVGDMAFELLPGENYPPGIRDAHAIASCDVDGDQDLDLYLTVGARGGRGLEPVVGVGNHFWTQSSFNQFDNQADGRNVNDVDGRGRGALFLQLDESPSPELLVLNYRSPPRLFQWVDGNWRDGPDVGAAVRKPQFRGPSCPVFVAAPADFDGDGDTDLYADGTCRGILLNDGHGSFEDVMFEAGVVPRGEVSHAATGDLDNDGDPDLVLTHLYGDGVDTWLNVSDEDGVRFTRAGTVPSSLLSFRQNAGLLGDLDNDGVLDLYLIQRDREVDAPDLVLRGQGDGTFQPVDWGAASPLPSLPVSGWPADLDLDGDLDLLLTQGDEHKPGHEGSVTLLENTTSMGGVTLELSSSDSPHGLGGSVRLEWEGRSRWRQVQSVNNRFSGSVLPVHFGVGVSAGPFVATVAWPEGEVEQVRIPAPGAYRVVKGRGLQPRAQ